MYAFTNSNHTLMYIVNYVDFVMNCCMCTFVKYTDIFV